MTASILAKKLAEGLDALVMDVKWEWRVYADLRALKPLPKRSCRRGATALACAPPRCSPI